MASAAALAIHAGTGLLAADGADRFVFLGKFENVRIAASFSCAAMLAMLGMVFSSVVSRATHCIILIGRCPGRLGGLKKPAGAAGG